MSAKNGVKIQKFDVEVSKTMVIWVESQVNSCLVAFFVKSFSMKPWYAIFGIFLGTTSHIMTPCAGLPCF
jgi:uncharacterized membrane protein